MSVMITEAIPIGSVEHIVVDVQDRLQNVSDLTGHNTRYDVRVKNAATYIQQGIVATTIGMRAFCLIDTNVAGYVPGRFELFVYFTNLPEAPRLGPIEFLVDA